MATSAIHSLYGVKIDATLIGGIQSQGMPLDTTVLAEVTSGEVHPRFVSISAQNPRMSVATLAIKAMLSAIGADGASIAGMGAGLTFYGFQHLKGGSRYDPASGSHRKYEIAEGMIAPTGLSGNHQDSIVLNSEAVVGWDGSVNHPIIITDDIALPAGLVDDERFALGPVSIESVGVAQMQSLDIAFPNQIVADGSDSDIWPTFTSLRSGVGGEIKIRSTDIELVKAANIPLDGKAVTHGNTAIYLKQRKTSSTFWADNESKHIKITAAGIAYPESAFEGSGSDPGEVPFVVGLRYDGTNAPLVITFNQTLP
jgi:hypothetical protein